MSSVGNIPLTVYETWHKQPDHWYFRNKPYQHQTAETYTTIRRHMNQYFLRWRS